MLGEDQPQLGHCTEVAAIIGDVVYLGVLGVLRGDRHFHASVRVETSHYFVGTRCFSSSVQCSTTISPGAEFWLACSPFLIIRNRLASADTS